MNVLCFIPVSTIKPKLWHQLFCITIMGPSIRQDQTNSQQLTIFYVLLKERVWEYWWLCKIRMRHGIPTNFKHIGPTRIFKSLKVFIKIFPGQTVKYIFVVSSKFFLRENHRSLASQLIDTWTTWLQQQLLLLSIPILTFHTASVWYFLKRSLCNWLSSSLMRFCHHVH